MGEAVPQAEYARRRGWAKSYVTQLKQQGRLVLTPEGLVDVEASDALIARTASPAWQGVSERHARERTRRLEQRRDEAMAQGVEAPGADSGAIDRVGMSLQKARAMKEAYLAMQARAQYEQMVARLLPRDDVLRAMEDVVQTVRSALDTLPQRVAHRLAMLEAEAVRGVLREIMDEVLAEMHRTALRRLADAGVDEEVLRELG